VKILILMMNGIDDFPSPLEKADPDVSTAWHSREGQTPRGIVNLGNLSAVSTPRTTANLLICSPGVGRAYLKNRRDLHQLDNALPKGKPSEI
jgi:hypothetical protein